MNLKSSLLIFLVILCVLFSTTCVFANENSTEILSYDGESETGLMTDNSEIIQESPDDEYRSFSELKEDLDKSDSIFNVTYNYKFSESDPEGSINLYKETLVINGNGHVFDGGNLSHGLGFEQTGNGEEILPMNIIINDLTFKNFSDSAIAVYGGNIILNNVNFTDTDIPQAMLFHIASESKATLNNCNFHSNSVENMISHTDSQLLTINNTNFYNNNFSSIITSSQSSIFDK